MELRKNQVFENRQAISVILGGDIRKGITLATKVSAILLFTNEEQLYTDYFYPKGTYDYCMYTGIGRKSHQDSLENNMYSLNIEVLSHQINRKSLLLFEKRNNSYYFVGEYRLLETHQNVQPDALGELRRVFVFHLKKISDVIKF